MSAANPARRLLVCAVVLVAGGFVASTMGLHASATGQVTQGKLPVKLSEKFTLRFPQGTTGVAWSPDSSILAVSSNYGGNLDTYDATGKSLRSFKANGNIGVYINSFAFLNGSSQVLFPLETSHQAGAALDIRDVATGAILKSVPGPYIAKHLAVSADQSRFAIEGGLGGEATTYGVDENKEWQKLSTVKGTGSPLAGGKTYWHGVNCLSFFPDNKLIALGKVGGYVSVVDSTTGEILKEFNPYIAPGNIYTPQIYSIDVSPRGDMLLAGVGGGGIRDGSGAVRVFEGVSIWRVKDGTPVTSLGDPKEMIEQVAWDSKDRFVAFIGSKSLFIWQPDKSDQNFIKIRYSGLTASLALSRDGKYLAVAEGAKVIVYNIQDNV